VIGGNTANALGTTEHPDAGHAVTPRNGKPRPRPRRIVLDDVAALGKDLEAGDRVIQSLDLGPARRRRGAVVRDRTCFDRQTTPGVASRAPTAEARRPAGPRVGHSASASQPPDDIRLVKPVYRDRYHSARASGSAGYAPGGQQRAASVTCAACDGSRRPVSERVPTEDLPEATASTSAFQRGSPRPG
jgi:hypothetical protein